MTRLLLIEDNDETGEEVAGYFRGRGYVVDRAATGPERARLPAPRLHPPYAAEAMPDNDMIPDGH